MQPVWLKPNVHAAWQTIPTFGKPATSRAKGHDQARAGGHQLLAWGQPCGAKADETSGKGMAIAAANVRTVAGTRNAM